MIIPRPAEVRRISGIKKWLLVYGRRKTGKTFLIENFIKWDEFFFVKRDRTIISKTGDGLVAYDTFIEILKRTLADGKTVVVDEFQRLGSDFFDFLHYTKKNGKLILVSSTLFLSRKLFGVNSALLGLFAEVPVGLISLKDCISALRKLRLDKKKLVELAILLREPIAIGYLDEKESARKLIGRVIISSINTVPALIGEIFVEEERSTSAIYDGILRAIAAGKVISGEISSYLFSRRLIPKDDPSVIQQHLSNLMQFGIIKKIAVYGKSRFIYKHVSPLAKLFYYADEKYNISERSPTEQELERIVSEVIPKLVEDNIRESFADKFGLEEAIAEAKDYDIDAYLLKFKKPELALEIKWKDKIDRSDIAKAERNLNAVAAKRRSLFVPDKKAVHSDIVDVSDVSDL